MQRERNAQVLIDELKGFSFVQDKNGLGDVYVAVLIENRDEVQRSLPLWASSARLSGH